MSELVDLSPAVRAFLKVYRWRRIDPIPFTPLRKSLRDAKVALASTAGFTAPGQPPFDRERRGGDSQYRFLDSGLDVSSLTCSHRSTTFDRSGIEADPNLAFPLDRLRELERDGMIGSVNHRHLSFMGSITKVGTLVEETAPEAARLLAADGVDVALLVPV